MGRRLDLEMAGLNTNFTAQLFFLISKADPVRREKLRKGFPVEVKMWEVWQESPSGKIVGPDDYEDESLEGASWQD